MLKVSNIYKTFKKAKQPTLKGVSFVVDNGEVYGLVGKNGAGKSTTIKCITGIYPFEKGAISVNAHDIKKEERDAKMLIGYVPDNHMVYENLTGREYINFMADVYGVNEIDRAKRIEKYSKIFNMANSLDLQISGYSHGMHQKICIMGALVHEPKLWILDEPFLGLDPQSVEAVKECIKDYSRNKRHMVIFSSHDIDTVLEVCDRVCVIEDGQVKDVLDVNTRNSRAKLLQLMS